MNRISRNAYYLGHILFLMMFVLQSGTAQVLGFTFNHLWGPFFITGYVSLLPGKKGVRFLEYLFLFYNHPT